MATTAARVLDSAAVAPSVLAIQDTVLGRLPAGVHPADTIILKRFAPAPVVQFIFQQPPWVMWSGAVLAAITALVLLWKLWPRFPAIWAWFRGWSRPVTVGFFAAVGLVLLVAGVLGFKSYDYVMNDSRFCTGCHIFMPPGQVVEIADTGHYTLVSQLSGKHDTLNCHSCHEFDPLGEARKMVLWMSGVRHLEEATDKYGAPAHGYVPRDICESCHKQGTAKQSWQAIEATAGHRLHLQSDSASGKLMSGSECLTCHAQTAHVFKPTDSTCSQQGCHLTDETSIQLGTMTGTTGLHCIVCHAFTAEVPALATLDSAGRTMRPAWGQCLSCHDMQRVLPDFQLARDPHGGQCGVCHNPHNQETPGAAIKSCASAQCHADWRDEPFHVGAAHRRRAQQCETCHQPHASEVDASDCEGCHQTVRERTRLRPPIPFDTTRALKRTALAPGPTDDPPRGKGDAPPEDDASGVLFSALAPTSADSFEHRPHRRLACIECHTTSSGRAGLSFQPPRGCDICHHQAPATSRCASCHQPQELSAARIMALHITVPKQPDRSRPVGFSHPKHEQYPCLECHKAPVTMGLTPQVASCRDCHQNHHEPARDCTSCHTGYDIRAKHQPGIEASHQRCDACHTGATVRLLVPTRSFCASCHAEQKADHHPSRECSVCHLLSEPAEWRRRLVSGSGP
ncbi:MAG TPA: hypothetical protein VGA78_14785 [Gemmatimonadales bacterium]